MSEAGGVVFRYRPEVLEALLAHGVRPVATTPPALVREFVNDLYRYEIRRLRDRLVAREFPRREYAGRVDALRRRYAVLAEHAEAWVIQTP